MERIDGGEENWGNVKCTGGDKGKESKIITDSEQTDAFKAKMTTWELRKNQDQLLKEAVMRQEDNSLKELITADIERGVVATKKFWDGNFIIEYCGDYITKWQAAIREEKYNASDVGSYVSYFNYKSSLHCINATEESVWLGRLVNHSRQGNCYTKLITINNGPI